MNSNNIKMNGFKVCLVSPSFSKVACSLFFVAVPKEKGVRGQSFWCDAEYKIAKLCFLHILHLLSLLFVLLKQKLFNLLMQK